MASPNTTDETSVSTDGPEMISLKLAKPEKEYWIEKDKLLKGSAYFRGMFAWEFKESETNQVIFYDEGDNIKHVFDIFMRFLTRESYSIQQYIWEEYKKNMLRFQYTQLAVFALFMHELWLDVFVLLDKYAHSEGCRQVVRDLSQLVAIFHGNSSTSSYKPWPHKPWLTVHPSYFRQFHYNRVLQRCGNVYPSDLQGIFALAVNSYYFSGIQEVHDTAFIDMARENPHLAVHVFSDWAPSVARNKHPKDKLQCTDSLLYELMVAVVMDNERAAAAQDLSKEAKEREWPMWFVKQAK